jgi:hypothetical protein
MVDLALLQSVSYIAGALGVCVAASYYVINLRETLRNRRVNLASTLMQNLISVEGSLNWAHMMTMQWSTIDEFEAKFSAKTGPENDAIRNNLWNTFDIIGFQYRSGLVDLDTLWAICNTAPAQCWAKFKPVIEEYRRSGKFSKNHYRDLEYLGCEIAKVVMRDDPSYRGNQTYYSSDL